MKVTGKQKTQQDNDDRVIPTEDSLPSVNYIYM